MGWLRSEGSAMGAQYNHYDPRYLRQVSEAIQALYEAIAPHMVGDLLRRGSEEQPAPLGVPGLAWIDRFLSDDGDRLMGLPASPPPIEQVNVLTDNTHTTKGDLDVLDYPNQERSAQGGDEGAGGQARADRSAVRECPVASPGDGGRAGSDLGMPGQDRASTRNRGAVYKSAERQEEGPTAVMVGTGGIEPPTSCLSSKRSTTELRAPLLDSNPAHSQGVSPTENAPAWHQRGTESDDFEGNQTLKSPGPNHVKVDFHREK